MLNSRREIMEMVIFICQNSTNPNDPELNSVVSKLQSFFSGKPVQARQLLYHASSITAISRECPVYTPCETIRVFDAYAYILTFVKLGCSIRHQTSTSNNAPLSGISNKEGETHHAAIETGKPPVRLDLVPWTRSLADMTAVDLWQSENSGYASIGNAQNIYDRRNFDKLKSEALRSINKLNIWRLSEKFYRTLESFN